jgi:exonuclease III
MTDPSKNLVWNMRGLNRTCRRDTVRVMVNSTKPDLVCLQETKKAVISRRMVMSMLGSEFDEFIFLPAQGTRGGILLAWKSTSCTVLGRWVVTLILYTRSRIRAIPTLIG